MLILRAFNFSPSLFQLQASEEKVNSQGLEVSPLKSKLQEKTEQSQQLQDQILKQQEALSRASQTLKAAGYKVKRASLSLFLTHSLVPPSKKREKSVSELLSSPVMLNSQDVLFRRIRSLLHKFYSVLSKFHHSETFVLAFTETCTLPYFCNHRGLTLCRKKTARLCQIQTGKGFIVLCVFSKEQSCLLLFALNEYQMKRGGNVQV